MDKGFNDDELADIMNEIESLEQEFTEEVNSAVAEEPEVEAKTEEPQTEVSAEEPVMAKTVEIDTEMEEVLSELSDMPVEEVSGEAVTAHDDNVHTLHVAQAEETYMSEINEKTNSGGHSQMSFSVEGDMKLDLSFNVSGKIVHLNINENSFEIELDGGMRFSIPLNEHTVKKAA